MPGGLWVSLPLIQSFKSLTLARRLPEAAWAVAEWLSIRKKPEPQHPPVDAKQGARWLWGWRPCKGGSTARICKYEYHWCDRNNLKQRCTTKNVSLWLYSVRTRTLLILEIYFALFGHIVSRVFVIIVTSHHISDESIKTTQHYFCYRVTWTEEHRQAIKGTSKH